MLNGVRVVFVKQVFSWMMYGELDEDFFVALNATQCNNNGISNITSISFKKSANSSSSLKNVKKAYNVVSSYVLLHQRIPASHVSPQLAAKILFAGKAVKVMMNVEGIANNRSDTLSYLSRGGSGVLWSSGQSLRGDVSPWSYRDQFELKLGRVSVELHQIHRDPDNAVMLLEELIEEMYTTVSDHLWMLLKDRLGFMNFFYALRNVYLLGKGELFQAVLDQVVLLTENSDGRHHCYDDGLWVRVLQNVAKSLSVDEEGMTDLLYMRCKQKGSIDLRFTLAFGKEADDAEADEMCLVGSVVRGSDGRIVLCPLSSSVNFLTPVSVAAGVNSISSQAVAADCFKGGVLFTDVKPITSGFTTAVNFTLSLNNSSFSTAAALSSQDNIEFDVLLASLSLSMCPSIRELETCLLRNQSVHRVGTVTVGVSIHGKICADLSLSADCCE